MMPRWASSSIWLEHRTHNPQVEGSNPSRPTNPLCCLLLLLLDLYRNNFIFSTAAMAGVDHLR
jgi:hypothetical protein